MSWRDCFKLQVVEPFMSVTPITLTTFGRALLKGIDRYGADDAMLYWVKLPSFGYFHDIARNRERWGQRVLFWHGREGFAIHWQPLPDGEGA